MLWSAKIYIYLCIAKLAPICPCEETLVCYGGSGLPRVFLGVCFKWLICRLLHFPE